jgi:acyl-coenzyme A thioesterase 13
MNVAEEVAQRYPRIKETVSYYLKEADGPSFWEEYVAKSLTIVAAVPDKLTWEFEVLESHCNQYV